MKPITTEQTKEDLERNLNAALRMYIRHAISDLRKRNAAKENNEWARQLMHHRNYLENAWGAKNVASILLDQWS